MFFFFCFLELQPREPEEQEASFSRRFGSKCHPVCSVIDELRLLFSCL